VIDRNDPVLARLPDDDDLPASFTRLPRAEQAWRGRIFAVMWILGRNEAYAWCMALAPDPDGENERAIREGADQRILDDLALAPLPR